MFCRNQGASSCTLSFVLPGFMKAGTTFLFDMLGKHSQVLLGIGNIDQTYRKCSYTIMDVPLIALRGFDFKETACYYKDLIESDSSQERMNCFPFVEDHEVYSCY